MVVKNTNQYCYQISDYRLDNLLTKKYLIIDLEATGLNYKKEEITEIAYLPLINDQRVYSKPKLHLLKITKKIPEKIVKLTGISNEDVAGGQEAREVFAELRANFADYIWVAQCGFEFDFPFLNRYFKELFQIDLPVQTLDTKFMYAFLYPETKETISTNFLLQKFAIDTTGIPRHRAAGDVEIITLIFQAILKEYQCRNIYCLSLKSPLTIKKFVPKPL